MWLPVHVLDSERGQCRDDLGGSDPLGRVDHFSAELLAALQVEALLPRCLDQPLDLRDRGYHRST